MTDVAPSDAALPVETRSLPPRGDPSLPPPLPSERRAESDVAPEPAVPALLAGRYEVRREIGRGGMGRVFEAHDRVRGERVALKLLLAKHASDPHLCARFLAEARLSSKLRHPNIVTVFDVQADGERVFLSMELLEGRTLRQVQREKMAAGKPFSVDEVLAMTRAVCAALHEAHKQLVHRDVKPENVFLTNDGTWKVMDFGVARSPSESTLTLTGQIVGTLKYMPPEQLAGSRNLTHRADQFAVAVIVYELLAGERPTSPPQPLASRRKDVPPAVSIAVQRALSDDASRRFEDMQAFANALGGVAKARAGASAFALVGLAVVPALALAGGAWWCWKHPDRPPISWLRHKKIDAKDKTKDTGGSTQPATPPESAEAESPKAAYEPPFVVVDDARELREAVEGGDAEALEALIDRKVSLELVLDETGSRAVHLAAALGQIELLEQLAAAGADLLAQDTRGATALLIAARSSDAAVASLLALAATPEKRNALVAQSDRSGTSPLVAAVSLGKTAVARALLDAGASADETDARGNTLLHVAAASCAPELAALLLDRSADAAALLRARNSTAETAYGIALKRNPSLARFLREKGGDV